MVLQKGNFLTADIISIVEAVKRRLKRLQLVGKDIGLFKGIELVQYGMRGVVFPAIKNEWHPEKKIFKTDDSGVAVLDEEGKRVRLDHPRWRSILMQSTLEYAVQYALFKAKVNAQVEVLQNGDVDAAIGQSTMVGASTSTEGLERMRQIFDRLFELGGGVVRTSDVTGLDWSVGALGGSHGFITILSARNPSDGFVSAVTACSWASYNSVYQCGRNLYAQTRFQTGMLCTSQEGGAARAINSILRWGVIETPYGLIPVCACISYSDDQVLAWKGPRGFLLDSKYRSPLDERDILESKPEDKIDFLGRDFVLVEKEGKKTLEYHLKRWQNSIASLVEPKILDGELKESQIAVTAQRISAFRH